jgi:hypothetical protein
MPRRHYHPLQTVPGDPLTQVRPCTFYARRTSSREPSMTTSDQPTPLTVEELDGLRRCARDPRSVDADLRSALAAKGMLQADGESCSLTPAGEHALHIGDGGMVPGLDN